MSNIKCINKNITEVILSKTPWVPEKISDANSVPFGDMPGDKIVIDANHISKAEIIFPRLLELLIPVFNEQPAQRAVVAVSGGSGVGKSEIASLLSYYFNCMGIGSYTLSGDNYPHRIPKYNDADRLCIFRNSGIKGLISYGQYNEERYLILRELQKNGDDASLEQVKIHPWLSVYQKEGRSGLKNYLGTENEIDFKELSMIVSQFKNGQSKIFLKRMGREETELWYDSVDFSGINVMIIEWTHGNNHNLHGVDIPILLNSTPEETLEHRRSRNRDGKVDSHFTTMVLGVEQEMLISQASRAKLIVSKDSRIISYNDFVETMLRQPQQEDSNNE